MYARRSVGILSLLLLVAALTGPVPTLAQPADATACESCPWYRWKGLYTAEMWRNEQGGLARGSVFLEKVDVVLDGDGGRLFGIPSLTGSAHVIVVNGHSLSGTLVGDAQGVSNIEAARLFRLFELWAEWRGASGESVRVGLYDLNSEFDALDTAGLFINASHGIGRDLSQSGRGGPSIFPNTSLAIRWKWAPVANVTAQVALLDGMPREYTGANASAIPFFSRDGAIIVGEAILEGTRVRKVALGAWYYTARFDLIDPADGDTSATTQRGSSGFYLIADVPLSGARAGVPAALNGFIRLGYADPEVNRFREAFAAGIVYTGVLGADDRLGIAVAAARSGSVYLQAQRELGLPYMSTETDVEATWTVPVNSWLTLQPDVQYVINPNAIPSIGNALVFGLRFAIALAGPGGA